MRKPALPDNVLARLGQQLRVGWALDVLHEPLPPKLADLLAQLRAKVG